MDGLGKDGVDSHRLQKGGFSGGVGAGEQHALLRRNTVFYRRIQQGMVALRHADACRWQIPFRCPCAFRQPIAFFLPLRKLRDAETVLQRAAKRPYGNCRFHIAGTPEHTVHVLHMPAQMLKHAVEFYQIRMKNHAYIVHYDLRNAAGGISAEGGHDPVGILLHSPQVFSVPAQLLPLLLTHRHGNPFQGFRRPHQTHNIRKAGDIGVDLPLFPEIGDNIENN